MQTISSCNDSTDHFLLKPSRRLFKGWGERSSAIRSTVSLSKKKKKARLTKVMSSNRYIKIEGEASPRSRRPVEVNKEACGGSGVMMNKVERQSSDVNEHAEAFIRRFKQQLLIQRLESLENFEKMLARGT